MLVFEIRLVKLFPGIYIGTRSHLGGACDCNGDLLPAKALHRELVRKVTTFLHCAASGLACTFPSFN